MQVDGLTVAGDPPEYAQELLLSSYIALHPNAPELRCDITMQQESTQEEVFGCEL